MSINLDSNYREILLEDIILSSLKKGIIPSIEDLELRLEEALADRDQGTIFEAKGKLLDYKEVSSVDKWNNTQHDIDLELRTLYRFISNLGLEHTNAFDKTSVTLDSLLAELKILEDRVENLILLSRGTEGYIGSVSDTFADVRKIDLENTTAFIDLTEQLVQGGFENGPLDNLMNRVMLNPEEVAMDFNITTKRFLLGQSAYSGTTLVDILYDTPKTWTGIAIASRSGPITAELSIRLPEEKEISKVSFDPLHSMGGGSLLVSVQYSLDGSIWKNIPIDNFIKEVKYKTGWVFPKTKLKFLRFTMTKSIPDRFGEDNSLIYEFGIKNISLFEMGYQLDSELISKPLIATNFLGENVKFSKISLDVCEILSEKTDIEYYVSFGIPNEGGEIQFPVDENQEIKWSSILPSSRNSNIYPKVLNVAATRRVFVNNIFFLDNRDPTYDLYRYAQIRDLKILDHEIIPEDTDTSLIILRNVKDPSLIAPYFFKSSEGYLAPRGWTLDGQRYSCWMNVKRTDGLELDFGSNPVYIDRVPIIGQYRISKGLHYIQVDKKNWYDLDGPNIDGRSNDITLAGSHLGNVTDFDQVTKRFTGDAPKSIIDPLFPYNHKYLIEGLSYKNSFDKPKVYPDSSNTNIASYKLSKISEFDLLNNTDNKVLDRFALINIDGSEFGSKNLIAKVPLVRALWPGDYTGSDLVRANNEKFIIFKSSSKLIDEDQSSTADDYIDPLDSSKTSGEIENYSEPVIEEFTDRETYSNIDFSVALPNQPVNYTWIDNTFTFTEGTANNYFLTTKSSKPLSSGFKYTTKLIFSSNFEQNFSSLPALTFRSRKGYIQLVFTTDAGTPILQLGQFAGSSQVNWFDGNEHTYVVAFNGNRTWKIFVDTKLVLVANDQDVRYISTGLTSNSIVTVTGLNPVEETYTLNYPYNSVTLSLNSIADIAQTEYIVSYKDIILEPYDIPSYVAYRPGVLPEALPYFDKEQIENPDIIDLGTGSINSSNLLELRANNQHSLYVCRNYHSIGGVVAAEIESSDPTGLFFGLTNGIKSIGFYIDNTGTLTFTSNIYTGFHSRVTDDSMPSFDTTKLETGDHRYKLVLTPIKGILYIDGLPKAEFSVSELPNSPEPYITPGTHDSNPIVCSAFCFGISSPQGILAIATINRVEGWLSKSYTNHDISIVGITKPNETFLDDKEERFISMAPTTASFYGQATFKVDGPKVANYQSVSIRVFTGEVLAILSLIRDTAGFISLGVLNDNDQSPRDNTNYTLYRLDTIDLDTHDIKVVYNDKAKTIDVAVDHEPVVTLFTEDLQTDLADRAISFGTFRSNRQVAWTNIKAGELKNAFNTYKLGGSLALYNPFSEEVLFGTEGSEEADLLVRSTIRNIFGLFDLNNYSLKRYLVPKNQGVIFGFLNKDKKVLFSTEYDGVSFESFTKDTLSDIYDVFNASYVEDEDLDGVTLTKTNDGYAGIKKEIDLSGQNSYMVQGGITLPMGSRAESIWVSDGERVIGLSISIRSTPTPGEGNITILFLRSGLASTSKTINISDITNVEFKVFVDKTLDKIYVYINGQYIGESTYSDHLLLNSRSSFAEGTQIPDSGIVLLQGIDSSMPIEVSYLSLLAQSIFKPNVLFDQLPIPISWDKEHRYQIRHTSNNLIELYTDGEKMFATGIQAFPPRTTEATQYTYGFNDNNTNSLFVIDSLSGSSTSYEDVETENRFAQAVLFRALFKSQLNDRSPVLEKYQIKLGI